jgi:hypothetical protein
VFYKVVSEVHGGLKIQPIVVISKSNLIAICHSTHISGSARQVFRPAADGLKIKLVQIMF